MLNIRKWSLASVALLVSGSSAVWADELKKPVRLEAAGKPIDTDVGHAAPFLTDFYGTGKLDLLVGQFGDGKLHIYKNISTNSKPEFAAAVPFLDDKKEGRVPTG
jgi:hypothetical protein